MLSTEIRNGILPSKGLVLAKHGIPSCYPSWEMIFQKCCSNESGIRDWCNDKIAQKVWGSFNNYNDIVGKLEWHIGEIGCNFVFKKVTDLTIDDDTTLLVRVQPSRRKDCSKLAFVVVDADQL